MSLKKQRITPKANNRNPVCLLTAGRYFCKQGNIKKNISKIDIAPQAFSEPVPIFFKVSLAYANITKPPPGTKGNRFLVFVYDTLPTSSQVTTLSFSNSKVEK